jgi:hypothetical protein
MQIWFPLNIPKMVFAAANFSKGFSLKWAWLGREKADYDIPHFCIAIYRLQLSLFGRQL